MVHALSRTMACGIFPDQDLNVCLLHWQADSLHTGEAQEASSWTLALVTSTYERGPDEALLWSVEGQKGPADGMRSAEDSARAVGSWESLPKSPAVTG